MLSIFIIVVIGLAALCAVFSWIYAFFFDLGTEQEKLKKLKDFLKEAHKEQSGKELAKQLKEEFLKEASPKIGEGRHVELRLNLLCGAAQSAAGMPSLHDLHELSLQDESSCPSRAILNTVISVLLILGILGTLAGVHGAIGDTHDGVLQISALRPALVPSMCAVACTIVLMWLRSGYRARLDHFLEEFDKLTITRLTPWLQPNSNLAANLEKFNKSIESFKEKMKALEKPSKDLEQDAIHIQQQIEDFGKIAEAMEQVGQKADRVSDDLKANEAKLQNDQKSIDQHLSVLKSGQQTISRHCQTIDNSLGDLQEPLQQSKEMFPRLAELVHTTTKDREQHTHAIQQLADHARSLSQYGTAIQELAKSLETLETSVDDLLKAHDHIKEQRDTLEASANLAYSCVGASEQAKDDAAAFLANLRQSRQNVDSKMNELNQQMEDALNRLQGSCRDLETQADEILQFQERGRRKH